MRVADQVNYIVPYPRNIGWSQVEGAITAEIIKAVRGEQGARAALDNAAQVVAGLLQ
jgi:hypothetical protein